MTSRAVTDTPTLRGQRRACDTCGSSLVTKWRGHRFCSQECRHALKRPAAERFEEKIEFDPFGGCWLWSGTLSSKGYGQFAAGGSPRLALTHRYAYERAWGPIPDRRIVCHSCDVPACCNPNHLFLGTPADNTADMLRKGREARGAKNGATKLTEEDVRQIRSSNCRGSELARRYGVSHSVISVVRSGKTWRWVQ